MSFSDNSEDARRETMFTPENIYLFKASSRNTRKRCEIGSKLTIKIPKQHQSGVTSFWCLRCNLWTYFTPFSSVSIVGFEQINVGRGC